MKRDAEPGSDARARLEERLRRAEQERDEARAQQHILQSILDRLPLSIFWKGTDLVYQGGNLRFAADAGLTSSEQIAGKRDIEMPWPEQAELFNNDDRAVMSGNCAKENYEEPQDRPNGERAWVRTTKVPLLDAQKRVIGVLGMYEDITGYKHAQAERIRLQEEIIGAQERTLRELSAPLIPISEGVVALIVIGAVDSTRGARLLESLLAGIASHRARFAIIDVTGVRDLGPEAARALLQAASAARLLGARSILTGISPVIARSLVEMQEDLGALVTLGNLKAGIEFALAAR